MPTKIIRSETLGDHTLLFDSVDSELVLSNNWYPVKDHKNGRVYCFTWDSVQKKNVSIHRLIRPKFNIVDHANGNGLDNRRDNLRNATHHQNASNSIPAKGYKGVSLRGSRYQVRLRVNGKVIFGGCYDNKIDGLLRYNELATLHFGEFAYLNKL